MRREIGRGFRRKIYVFSLQVHFSVVIYESVTSSLLEEEPELKRKLLALALALGLTLSLAACSGAGTAATPAPASAAPSQENPDSDMAYVQNKGTLVVGITDFAPMDYRDGDGNWIGFDADMAKAFAAKLGVEVQFIEITWGNKALELETKAIDVVWNGMTLDDEVLSLMGTSEPYCLNGQVVVVPASKAADYQTVESLSGLNFAVENESAGAKQLDALGLSYVAKTTQADALMEVASGASEACVIDLLMAGAMIGEGTSYPDLTYTVQLNSEEYGVGFRVGSDLVDAFNDFWKEAYDNGTVMETAIAYGVQESIIEK